MSRLGVVFFVSIAICAVLMVTLAASASSVYAAPGPSLKAIETLAGDSVALFDWSEGMPVTVDVLSGPGGGVVETGTVPIPASGTGVLVLSLPLAPGQVVRTSDGTTTKEITLSLTVQADATADVISGDAPWATPVAVEVCNPGCSFRPVVIADAAGHFVVSAGALPSADIQLGTTFWATITDGDGDGERVEGAVSPTVSAVLRAGVPGGTIVLNGWPGFPAATLTISVFASPGGPLVTSFSGPPDANGFLLFGTPTLAFGQLVRATDGVTTKELTLVPLAIQGNTATDTLSGSAPAAALVTVQAHCGPASTACVAKAPAQRRWCGRLRHGPRTRHRRAGRQ